MAGGVGRHLDIDPVIVRVAFVVLTFFGGAGLLLYGACWLLLPRDDEAKAKIDLDPAAAARLIGIGVLAALATIGEVLGNGCWGRVWFPLPRPARRPGSIVSADPRRTPGERYAAAYAGYGPAMYGPQTYGPQTGWGGAPPRRPLQPARRPDGSALPPRRPPRLRRPSPPRLPRTASRPPVLPLTPAPQPRDPRKRGPSSSGSRCR